MANIAANSYTFIIYMYLFSLLDGRLTLNDMYTIAYHAKSAFILSILSIVIYSTFIIITSDISGHRNEGQPGISDLGC